MTTTDQPDILLILSDQHSARLMGCATPGSVDTPHLDALAAGGVRCSAASTACPLCVPARFSLLSGHLPSRSGVYGNGSVMPSGTATVAHALGAAGYESTLCGRMHFQGQDQRHGFEQRLVGDFTPCLQGRSGHKRADLGPYVCTPAGDWAKHFGGGESPVLAYDRAVTAAACAWLEHNHERPQFLVVGTYGPHHTFVAPEDLYRKYLERVDAPLEPDDCDMHPRDRSRVCADPRVDAEARRCIRAAYLGMIEHIDQQIGSILAAWQASCARRGRPALVCYCSDHGEQAGDRGLWGKMSFYDDAVGIPMIWSGDDIVAGRTVAAPVGICDIASTLTAAAAAPPLPTPDGIDLLPMLQGGEPDAERGVLSEILLGGEPGRLLRRGRWSYIAYADHPDDDVLFDRQADPRETRNCIAAHPLIAAALRAELWRGWDPAAIRAEQARRQAHETVLGAWGAAVPLPEPDRWPVPASSWALPTR